MVLVHPPALSKRYLPTKVPPYGMAVLCAHLKACGIPVRQHDLLPIYLHHSPQDPDFHSPAHGFGQAEYLDHLQGRRASARLAAFAAKYADPLPRPAPAYAFSIMAYPQYWAALLLAQRLRRLAPKALIVFGGPFITIQAQLDPLTTGLVDLWLRGSGEAPLALLGRMLAGPDKLDLARLPGAWFRQGDQERQNPPASLPAAKECIPDFSGLDLSEYRLLHPATGRQTLFLPYRISKGCVSRCSFCTGRLVDEFGCKPPDKVVGELKTLAETYGSRDFVFCDASVNANPALLAQICRRLAAELPGMSWYAYARVSGFSAKLLALARRSGCFSLFWGVEAMHQPTVRLLGKGFRVQRVGQLLAQCQRLGIKSHLHLMYHTPNESLADALALRDLVEPLLDSPWVEFALHRFLLEPGSLMARRPGDYGLCELTLRPQALFERCRLDFAEVGGADPQSISQREALIEANLGPMLARLRQREADDRAIAPRL
ncbi:MAG: radical SAM protein [Pseudomonadota bacterium]